MRKPKRRRNEQNRRLNTLTQQKNDARKKLRRARKDGLDQTTIETVAREFHRLLRLHSKESRISAKSTARMEALKARTLCAKSFWRFAARILDKEEDNISPTFTADDAEAFFRGVYNSESSAFERPEWLPVPPPPTTPFNTDPISTEELQQVLHRAKSGSTPSPRDRIPYTILKRCPSLSVALADIYNACWSSASVPEAWKVGVIRLIPKVSAQENPNKVANFRPIALTSCIGKVFTTILKNRWLTYMLRNSYMERLLRAYQAVLNTN